MPEVHSRFGYSAVSTFEQCPFRYKCQYVDGLQTLPTDDPANALVIGTALHRGIETDVETAIQEYFNSYPIIDDLHINEEIKLRYLIPKVKEIIPDGIHELQVVDKNFIGTLDLLVPALDPGTPGLLVYDLYDFKYINPNNVGRYLESKQLHLYKYYFEKVNPGKRIRDMYFIFIPKVQIRQKKTEDLYQFRKRLMEELNNVQIQVQSVQYDPQKVIDHLELTQDIMTCTDYPKNPTRLCDWCDYKNYCEKGEMTDMALPSTQEVALTISNYKKIWVYGEPFSGKTHLAAEAPKPILELNTDGNIKHYTMPRIPITDTKEGRQTIPAWEVFKNAIDDLAAGSDFKTIVLDLTEDIYDHCRKYMCDKRGWEHESDDSFKAYDIVRNEFLREIRKLVNLPYNIILISHEDVGRDLTKRSGDKVTRIQPNIADKIAKKLAGMVDIVIRATKDNDNYMLSTKTSDVIFGGGRLTGIKAVDVPNTWDSIDTMYAAVGGQETPVETEEPTAEEVPAEPEKPTKRDRKTADTPPEVQDDLTAQLKAALGEPIPDEVEPADPPAEQSVEQVEEAPKRRTRRTRQ